MKIAIDTNVLVRYLVWDDEHQARLAAERIEAADAVVIPTVVFCETVWVLTRAYKLPHRAIGRTLRDLVETKGIEIERLAVEAGLEWLEQGGDFADGVILQQATRSGAEHVVTFDRKMAKAAPSGQVELIAR